MTEQTPRILVVDDDTPLLELLESYLSGQGFAVRGLTNGNQLTGVLEEAPVDLIVLDLMLPGRDGLTICQELRESGNMVPIIMLTAKGSDTDRIRGLDVGADDYLGKPFNPRELVSRIQAVLRRHQITSQSRGGGARTFTFGDFTLDYDERHLIRNGQVIPLRTSEFDLLRVFIEHRNQVLTRDQIMELTRGQSFEAYDRSIDVQISRLRRIIEPDSSHPSYVLTVWGTGYCFRPDGRPV